MKQMSFALTTEQMLARTKTVTRRTGWAQLKPGTLLQAVEKSQGLRKGQRVRKLGVIRVVDVRRETLFAMRNAPPGECAREGFPDLTPAQFIAMFCTANDCTTGSVVTRIEFEHLCRNRSTFEDAGTDRRGVDVYRCTLCNATVPADETDHVEGLRTEMAS